ncbi:MAG: mechanosensitive ion channel family protein [Candidatus Saccharibacteria bacterium]|nr:mechanosensitive ion channel family protein [Candidatus Saccharibacteria bacterium]
MEETTFWDPLIEFGKDHGLNILIILAAAYVARKFVMVFVTRLIRNAIQRGNYKTITDEKLREDTLIGILGTALRVAIWVVAGLLLLSEFNVEIGPLLAGAGIAGVALGFGAQSMVANFLSGIFIILENQYRVGDVVQINQGVAGIVEELTLRTTVLRDLDGMQHHIPNGEITLATNMTMEFANVNLNVGVGYDTDLDKLERIINEVGSKMAKEEPWDQKIMEVPAMLRVDNFGDSSIDVKITGKTKPMQQWAVTGELRKRLKKAFDKNGIEIPFPQRVMHEAPKPAKKK